MLKSGLQTRIPALHSVKKVLGINHSKSPLKEIVKNFFDANLAPLTVLYTDVEFERDLSFGLFTVLDAVSLSQVCFAIFPMDKKSRTLNLPQTLH